MRSSRTSTAAVQAEEVIARIEGLIDPEIEVVNPPEAQTMGFALTLTC